MPRSSTPDNWEKMWCRILFILHARFTKDNAIETAHIAKAIGSNTKSTRVFLLWCKKTGWVYEYRIPCAGRRGIKSLWDITDLGRRVAENLIADHGKPPRGLYGFWGPLPPDPEFEALSDRVRYAIMDSRE